MKLDEFIKMLKEIVQKYGWKNHMLGYAEDNPVKLFKYVTFNLDTRDMKVWSISFYLGGKEKNFNVETKEDIDKVYQYMRGEINE